MLRDEFEVDVDEEFKNDELDLHINEVLVEISQVSPYKAVEPIILAANSRLLDISGITGLIKATHVEYPVVDLPSNPRVYHNIEYIDNETVEMVVSSTPTAAGTEGHITGVVTFTASSATVTGTGAAVNFTGQLEEGSFIKPSTGKKWYRVLSIESISSLTLEETVKSRDACVDSENASDYRTDVAIVYCEKVHEVTESSSTLAPDLEKVLVDGVVVKATLAWLNKMRDAIVPTSYRWYHQWANNQLMLYRNALNSISVSKAWEY